MSELAEKLKEVCSEDELHTAMECTPLKKGYIRLSAMLDLMYGVPKETVIRKTRISVRTFQFWVQRFLESGIDALINKPRPGRPKILSRRHSGKLIDLLENPAKANETHWTAVKLHGYAREKCRINISYSTLLRELHRAGYTRRVPRKMPAEQDHELRKAFKIRLEEELNNPRNEIWFADETGIEGDPAPRKRWIKKGEKSTVPYYGKHIRANVLGAVCPETGEFSTLVADYCDSNSFQTFIDQLAMQTRKKVMKHIILVLDNASWHKTKELNWHHITPMFLPPYSPDFNPIERLWKRIKEEFFSDFTARSPEELWNRICRAVRFFSSRSSFIMKTCRIRKDF